MNIIFCNIIVIFYVEMEKGVNSFGMSLFYLEEGLLFEGGKELYFIVVIVVIDKNVYFIVLL